MIQTRKLEDGAYVVSEDGTWLAGASRIGFVLGGGDGLGHGVYATGPLRIVVTGFEVGAAK